MRRILVFSLLFIWSSGVFAQRKYSFETPWKALSNDSIMEWFTDRLDSTSDSLLFNIFDNIGVNTDSVEWIYTSPEFYTLHKNGWDYYSRRIYVVNNRDKKLVNIQKNVSRNRLPNSLFNLDYYYKDGVTTLVLVEYY